MPTFVSALTALALAAPPPGPPVLDMRRHDGTPRIVLIGDTGEPGPIVERWTKTLAKKDKDAVLVLGDLVYPQAPPCPTGTPDRAGRQLLEANLAAPLEALGAPVLLVLGNHDTSWVEGEPLRERCVLSFVRPRATLELPAPYYAADFGVAVVVVLDSNHLDDAQAAFAKRVFDGVKPGVRKILAAHHVLRTFHDKEDEDLVWPWIERHGLAPDLYVNGHAHVLQLGHYHGIWAVTSGTAARPRERPSCDSARGPEGCGDGQRFGSSIPGYALLDIAADGAFTVTFEDADGQPLHTWTEGPR